MLWYVWSTWRGDRAKLGRIAAAMEQCAGGRPAGRASVTVGVLGDRERYPSFTAFAREAPTQTTQQFDWLRFEIIREGLTMTVTVRRTPGQAEDRENDARDEAAWHAPDHDRGVMLTVKETKEGDAADRVAAAITRGSLQWQSIAGWPLIGRLTNYKPTPGSSQASDGRDARAALDARNASRFKVMWAWTAFWALLFLYVVYVAVRPVWDAPTGEALTVLVVASAAAAVAGRRPVLQDLVLPAIEVAELTPGRRAARRLTVVAAPISAAVARAVFGG